MFKKIYVLLFLFVFVLTGCNFNNKKKTDSDVYREIIKRDKLIVGVQFNAKPFGYKDKNGKLKGVDVDIARELAERILGDDDKVEFKQVTPASRIESITSGEVDLVIATMSITPQRKLVVAFSDPYYIAGQAILLPAKTNIHKISDLNNKPVAVVLGTTGERNLRHFAPKVILRGYRNYSKAFYALKSKDVKAMTTDDSLLLGFIMDNSNFIIFPKKLTKEPYGIAMKKSADAQALRANVNRHLNNMKHDGFLSELYKKWSI